MTSFSEGYIHTYSSCLGFSYETIVEKNNESVGFSVYENDGVVFGDSH